MQTILQILKKAGGWHHGLYLKIENPPYMALVIEATDESGPMGLARHLRRSLRRTERRPHARPGDVFRAWPCRRQRTLTPFYCRNDYLGVEQWSRNIVRDHYVF